MVVLLAGQLTNETVVMLAGVKAGHSAAHADVTMAAETGDLRADSKADSMDASWAALMADPEAGTTASSSVPSTAAHWDRDGCDDA